MDLLLGDLDNMLDHISPHIHRTYPIGRAKSLLLRVGLIVPVEEADEAEELESSSRCSMGWSVKLSVSTSRSSKEGGRTGGKPASLALAKDFCKLLMMNRGHSTLGIYEKRYVV